MSTIAQFSLADYDRMIASGALDGRRLELVRGEILEMSPIGSLHEVIVSGEQEVRPLRFPELVLRPSLLFTRG